MGERAFDVPAESPAEVPLPACKRQVDVTSDADLAMALASAAPGDCLLLADGTYKALKISAKGSDGAPIVVRAKNRLGAKFASGQLVLDKAQHLVFDGITFAMPSTFKLIDCQHCRITRSKLALTVADDWVLIYGADSHHNRIDRCDIGPKPTPGPLIVFGQETTMSKNDRVDRNWFHDNGPPAVNEKESVRIGWSGVSQQDGLAVVEHNLFENCDGDPEIVSVKTNRNVVRHNTVRTSTGVLSLRHGNDSFLYGNIILGGGKTLPCTDRQGASATCETGGIRLYGRNHKVFDNYVEGTTGTGHRAPLQIDGGDGTSLDSHAQVVGVDVVANTLVDNASGIEIGKNYSMPPKDVVVSRNLVRGPAGKLIQNFKPQATVSYTGNQVWAGTPDAAVGVMVTGIDVADPRLVRMGELWTRSAGSPSVGASLGSRVPLTRNDVGPQAP